jgi:transcriptional regulator GlxA family with amidase domain
MRKQDAGYDYRRYQKLLAEAVDEPKRLALIELLMEENAKRRLDVQRLADRDAMTAATIAGILGNARNAA